MHCPNCGAEATTSQKFCRACGLSLDRFAQLLAELLPDGEDESVTKARRRLRQLERALTIAGWTAGSVLAILLASAGIYVMAEHNIGGGIFLLGFGIFIIAGMLLARYQSALAALDKKVSGHSTSQPALPSAETTNKLLSEDQHRIAMSVTEQTTAHLEEKIESRR